MRKLKPSKKLKISNDKHSKSKIKISACYIVKNESKNLSRSIESLKTQVDEIIVVDTGSTDNTIDIAKSYGAKVIETEWQDDFSAPRNLAIDSATGDWIIFIDADEFFVKPDKVRAAVEKLSNTDGIFVMRIDIDEDNNYHEINRDWYLRAFRNVDYLRYRGMIHENVENINGGSFPRELANEDLLLYHTGYGQTKAESKLRRNLSIIQLEAKKYGEKPQHYIALADCYFGLADYEKTLYYAEKTLTAEIRPITGLASLYRKIFTSMHKLNFPLEDILNVADEAIETLPQNPEFYVERGFIFYVLKQYDKAYTDLKESLNVWHNMLKGSVKKNSYFDYLAEDVYVKLTELEAMTGNYKAAKHNLKEAIKLAPQNDLYKQKYIELENIEKSTNNV